MNKKLLAAAIAAAVALPMAAQAGVQIYGVVHASIDYVDPDNTARTFDTDNDGLTDTIAIFDEDSFWDVTSNTSRIGFKGSEDLGNGLKAIWKMEGGWNITEGGFNGNRNSYIGLAGDWGTFFYGRHDTPLKISTGKLDLFADRTADYNFGCPGSDGIACIGFTDRRQSDTIVYISPNMNGLTFAAAIIPGKDAGFGANGLADGYSAAAMYSNNGLFASLAYEDITDWTDDLIDDTIWRAGAGYEMNAFSVGFIYENEDLDAFELDKWQVSASFTFGNNVAKAMYYDWEADDLNVDGDAWAIGIDHNLSSRTTAYLLYTDTGDSTPLHNYSAGAPLDILQPDQTFRAGSAVGMGMIHKF